MFIDLRNVKFYICLSYLHFFRCINENLSHTISHRLILGVERENVWDFGIFPLCPKLY